MFSATKFIVAGVIVALFGGYLLAGVLTPQPSDDSLPAAVSPASTEPDASKVAAPTTEVTNAPERTATADLLPGTFTPAGSLADERGGFTVTLLPDGRVLVVGGSKHSGSLDEEGVASAQVWDPQTETFSPAGSLAEARGEHTATPLPDGRVLVVGGRDAGRRLATAEIWDPTTTTFGPAGSLARPRYGHKATALPDGRVLILGGWWDHQSDKFATTVEIWDPATGAFSPAGKLSGIGFGHSVTQLPDGRILVVGGEVSGDESARAQVWDPTTGAFNRAGSLAQRRRSHTATLLADGRVLVVGGERRNRAVVTAETWDPQTERFSPAGSLIKKRKEEHTTTLLTDGRVLVVGGRHVLAEVWDPVTATFSPAGSLAEARRHSAWLLPDGRVLVVGGGGNRLDVRPTSAEIWDPATETFSPAGSSAEGRAGHYTHTLLPDGRVLVIGGWDGNATPIASAEVWEPSD